jgi:LPXTG-motif cell wall-anchored protein
MRRKLLALFGATAVALVGAVAFAAGPAQAATPAVALPSVTGQHCEFPDAEIKALDEIAPAKAQAAVSGVISEVIGCIQLEVVDKCDGRTVITLTNWAVSDNKWTRLTVKILGVEYVVKGGPDHTPVVITLGPPGVEDVQAYVVFEFNGWHIEKPVGDPYTWVKPSACVDESPSPSPSPSVTVSPSPSVSVSTSTPTTTAPAPVLNGPDLPTTGDSLTKPAVTGGVALALGGLLLLSMFLKRRRTAIEDTTQE